MPAIFRTLLLALAAPLIVEAATPPTTEFHFAAKQGDVGALARALAAAPDDVDRPDAAGVTPLMFAAQEGHGDAVAWLLARGANPNHADRSGFTPLIAAVVPPAGRDRLAAGFSDATLTALYEAVRKKSTAAVARPDAAVTRPRVPESIRAEVTTMFSPLSAELQQRKARIIELLVAAGASTRSATSRTGTALHWAVQSGGEILLDPLLRAGADPNSPAPVTLVTPLHVAAIAGNAPAVRCLLARGADPEALSASLVAGQPGRHPGAGGHTPLMSAILMGRGDLVQLLIEGGAKLETSSRTFDRALHLAAAAGHTDIVGVLLDRGARHSVRDRWHAAPLNYAAANGHLAVVSLLVERGADLESADEAGYTPLLDAIEQNSLEVVKYLAAKGANFRVRTLGIGKSPLRVAATAKNAEIARYLIEERGEKTNGEPADRQRPLLEAVASGSPRVSALLLEHGADPNAPDVSGSSCLHAAVVCRVSVQARWLRDRGIASTSKPGATYGAPVAGDEAAYDEILRLLAARGARLDAPDNSGDTALHLAGRYGATTALSTLLALGADRTVQNRRGQTALDLAVEHRQVESVKLLGGAESLVDRPAGPSARERLTEVIQRRSVSPAPAAAPADTIVAEALLQRGRQKLATDVPGALAEFNRALELQPRNADTLLARGDALRASREPVRALADYTAALALAPNNPAAFLGRAAVRQTQNDSRGAITDYNRAIQLDPKSAQALIGRGSARTALGELDAAIADFTRGIELDPASFLAFNDRGVAHRAQGRHAAAIADFDEAIRLNARHGIAYNNRGIARQALGDFAGAVSDYDSYIASNKNATYPRLFRHLALRRAGRDASPAEIANAIGGWTDGWPKTLGRFLAGEITAEDLLERAAGGTGSAAMSRPCEAHCFIGLVELLAGRTATARFHFEQGTARNLPMLSAFIFARTELARLGDAR